MKALSGNFSFIEHERLFFDAAFRYDDQNSLRDHDYRDDTCVLHEYDREQDQRSRLSSELNFILEMYCRGSVYMTTRWVSGEIELYSGRNGKASRRGDACSCSPKLSGCRAWFSDR